MCGIISASSEKVIDFNSIKLGILNADDRGGHSCGVALRGEEPNIIRQVSNARTFINDKKSSVKFPRKNTSFIGHTRFATQGSKTIDNAHPFRFGEVTGVHNGSIENFTLLKNRYIHSYRQDVEEWCGGDWKQRLGVKSRNEIQLASDSRLLYYLIWKKGIKKTLPLLKGTLGLIFYTKEQGEEYMYLYRWDKPMCYGYKDGVMWIGSLKKYLRSLGCTKIKQVTEHSLYKVKNGRIITAKQLPKEIEPNKKKHTVRDDFDEELEPERKKTTTTTNTTYYTGACGVASKSKAGEDDGDESDVDTGFRFCAPKSAKGDIDQNGNIVLYWFSHTDPDIVYIEKHNQTDVEVYNLVNSEDLVLLQEEHEVISDYIMEDYDDIKLISEYRDEL